MIEDRTEAGADASLAEVNRIAAEHRGRDIENSIPKVLRANPFTPLNNVVGPRGERWAPVHTIVPHSKAVSVTRDVQAIFDKHARRHR